MATPWLKSKLEPKTSGTLGVSVRYLSGQVSTFSVSSTATVAELKELAAKEAILASLSAPSGALSEPMLLLHLGTPLEDAATLEACRIADGSCLVQAAATVASAAAGLEAFKAAAAQVHVPTERHPTHTAALYERIKHNPARGLDLDYDLPSWHLDYKPYAQYVPPKDGKPQVQAAAYEQDGAQAFRRDYYRTGPGAELNKELQSHS